MRVVRAALVFVFVIWSGRLIEGAAFQCSSLSQVESVISSSLTPVSLGSAVSNSYFYDNERWNIANRITTSYSPYYVEYDATDRVYDGSGIFCSSSLSCSYSTNTGNSLWALNVEGGAPGTVYISGSLYLGTSSYTYSSVGCYSLGVNSQYSYSYAATTIEGYKVCTKQVYRYGGYSTSNRPSIIHIWVVPESSFAPPSGDDNSDADNMNIGYNTQRNFVYAVMSLAEYQILDDQSILDLGTALYSSCISPSVDEYVTTNAWFTLNNGACGYEETKTGKEWKIWAGGKGLTYDANSDCVWRFLGDEIDVILDFVDTESTYDVLTIGTQPWWQGQTSSDSNTLLYGGGEFSGESPPNKRAKISMCQYGTLKFTSDGGFQLQGFTATVRVSEGFGYCSYEGPTDVYSGWTYTPGIMAAIVCGSIGGFFLLCLYMYKSMSSSMSTSTSSSSSSSKMMASSFDSIVANESSYEKSRREFYEREEARLQKETAAKQMAELMSVSSEQKAMDTRLAQLTKVGDEDNGVDTPIPPRKPGDSALPYLVSVANDAPSVAELPVYTPPGLAKPKY